MANVVGNLQIQIDGNVKGIAESLDDVSRELLTMDSKLNGSLKGVIKLTEEYQRSFEELYERHKAVADSTFDSSTRNNLEQMSSIIKKLISEGDWQGAISVANDYRNIIADSKGPLSLLYAAQAQYNNILAQAAQAQQRLGDGYGKMSTAMADATSDNVRFSVSVANSLARVGKLDDAINTLKSTVDRTAITRIHVAATADPNIAAIQERTITRLTLPAMKRLVELQQTKAKSEADSLVRQADAAAQQKDFVQEQELLNQALKLENLYYKDREAVLKRLQRASASAASDARRARDEQLRGFYERAKYLMDNKEFEQAQVILEINKEEFARIRKKAAAERDLLQINKELLALDIKSRTAVVSISDAVDTYEEKLKSANFTKKQAIDLQKEFLKALLKEESAKLEAFKAEGLDELAIARGQEVINVLKQSGMYQTTALRELKAFEKSLQSVVTKKADEQARQLIDQIDNVLQTAKSRKDAIDEALKIFELQFGMGPGAAKTDLFRNLSTSVRTNITQMFDDIEQRYNQFQTSTTKAEASRIQVRAQELALQGNIKEAIEELSASHERFNEVLGKADPLMVKYNRQLLVLKNLQTQVSKTSFNEYFRELLAPIKEKVELGNVNEAYRDLLAGIENLNKAEYSGLMSKRKQLELLKLESKIRTEIALSAIKGLNERYLAMGPEGPNFNVSKFQSIQRIAKSLRDSGRVIESDLEKVDQAIAQIDKSMKRLRTDSIKEVEQAARALSESLYVKGDFTGAIKALEDLRQQFISVYGAASVEVMKLSTDIDKLNIKISKGTTQENAAEAALRKALERARILVSQADVSINQEEAASKYKEALDSVSKALEDVDKNSKRTSTAIRFLSDNLRKAADSEAELMRIQIKEMASSGNVRGALESAVEYRDAIEATTPVAERLMAAIDQTTARIDRYEKELQDASSALRNLSTSGGSTAADVNQLNASILSTETSLEFWRAELEKQRKELELLDKKYIVSRRVLQNYANDVASLTRRLESSFKRFNIDPAQLGQAFLGATIGAFSMYDALQNAAFAIRQFIVDGINLSNQLKTTEYSATLVSKTLENFSQISRIARDNQRLFGGTLNDNLKELTGFTLVARTAGVDLRSLVAVSQRLAAFDPAQGIGGASIALREFLAGNIRSLRERFELPGDVLKKLGDEALDAQERLNLLSNFLDEQGLSMESIRGQLNLTQQAYRDLGIAWENTSRETGRSMSLYWKPFVQVLTQVLDVSAKAANLPKFRAMDLLGVGDFEADLKKLLNFQFIADPGALTRVVQTRIYEGFGLDRSALNEVVKEIEYILEISPDAEVRIESIIAEFKATQDVEKFRAELQKVRGEVDQLVRTEASREFLADFLDQWTPENMPTEEFKDLATTLLNVSYRSDEAALVAEFLAKKFQIGELSADQFRSSVAELDAQYSLLANTEEFAAERQELAAQALERYTKALIEVILLVRELNALEDKENPPVELFSRSEMATNLEYIKSELLRVRAEANREILQSALNAVVDVASPTEESLRNLSELTGYTGAQLLELVTAWRRVREAESEAEREAFKFSQAALLVELTSAKLNTTLSTVEESFKLYAKEGKFSAEAMQFLLSITDNTGRKIYENEAAVYAAAEAYKALQEEIKKTNTASANLTLPAIAEEVKATQQEIQQLKITEIFDEYALSGKLSADSIKYLSGAVDENGVAIYKNRKEMEDAAKEYAKLSKLKEELNDLTGESTEGTDDNTTSVKGLVDIAKEYTAESIKAKIETEKFNATQNQLDKIFQDTAKSGELSAQHFSYIELMLGPFGIKVAELAAQWKDLNLAMMAGYLMDKDPMLAQMQRYGATMQQYKDYLSKFYGIGSGEDEDTGTGTGGGGGSSQKDSLEQFYEDMSKIAEDYRKDVLEAERDYQQKLLDIQEEFQRKQAESLLRSELGKRRTRASFYENLINSDLSQEAQQNFSAQYEELHAKSMTLAQEGKAKLGQEVLELGTAALQEQMRYEAEIAKAMSEGDTARADAYRMFAKQAKDAYEIEMRELLAAGDSDVVERDKAIEDANKDLSDSLQDVTLKASERAKALLENEAEIIAKLDLTNQELAEQFGFLSNIAQYTDPAAQGFDSIGSAANTALTKVKDLVSYIKQNPVGTSFIGGVSAGIESGKSEVENVIDDTGDHMIDHAKRNLEAQSPSKRTMREIGLPFAQGIARGILSYANAVKSSARTLVDGAVKVAKRATSNLPPGIQKNEQNIEAFKNIAQTNISILEGLRGLLPDTGGSAQGRASYVAEMARIDQDTEAQITARREKLARDLILARTDDERRILEAIAQQDIALLQQQANIQKSSQQEQLRNVVDQEAIDAKMREIQQNAAMRLEALQERLKELAKTNPEEAARIYQIRAQQILEVANLRQELERYLLENNLTTDDAFASLLRQQIEQVNALAQMEIKGTGVGNAPINNTVYNINMDLTGSNLRKEDVRKIVQQELSKALANSRGSTG